MAQKESDQKIMTHKECNFIGFRGFLPLTSEVPINFLPPTVPAVGVQQLWPGLVPIAAHRQSTHRTAGKTAAGLRWFSNTIVLCLQSSQSTQCTSVHWPWLCALTTDDSAMFILKIVAQN